MAQMLYNERAISMLDPDSSDRVKLLRLQNDDEYSMTFVYKRGQEFVGGHANWFTATLIEAKDVTKPWDDAAAMAMQAGERIDTNALFQEFKRQFKTGKIAEPTDKQIKVH